MKYIVCIVILIFSLSSFAIQPTYNLKFKKMADSNPNIVYHMEIESLKKLSSIDKLLIYSNFCDALKDMHDHFDQDGNYNMKADALPIQNNKWACFIQPID